MPFHLWSHSVSQSPNGNTKDPCIPFVPKAFSPNGDGINDVLQIQKACNIDSFSLKIYTPSGELVYEHRYFSPPWDGNTQAGPLPQGRYRWEIHYHSTERGADTLSGILNLIR